MYTEARDYLVVGCDGADAVRAEFQLTSQCTGISRVGRLLNVQLLGRLLSRPGGRCQLLTEICDLGLELGGALRQHVVLAVYDGLRRGAHLRQMNRRLFSITTSIS